jgi:hypothetical protein
MLSPRPLRSALIVSLAAAALVLQAACARSVNEEIPSDPPLFAPDATKPAALVSCVQTECPAPWATCPGTEGLCTTDTSRDVKHCGSCDTACPRPPNVFHATAVCTGGKCALACDELYADCNKSEKDGCETSTSDDPKNCGTCGNVCKDGDICWRGACGCPSGYTQCGDDCKLLDSDRDNCGACGQLCRAPARDNPAWLCGPGLTPPNTLWTCASAACILDCKPYFGNCNTDLCADGCEIDLKTDRLNCGACGNACEANQDCVEGTCICPAGTTRCGDVCTDLAVDPDNCGECSNPCPGPTPSRGRGGEVSHGSPSCRDGKCDYTCFPGFADCNNRLADGCEVDITSDPTHCGNCGTKCNAALGQPCVMGQCLTKPCEPGPGIF